MHQLAPCQQPSASNVAQVIAVSRQTLSVFSSFPPAGHRDIQTQISLLATTISSSSDRAENSEGPAPVGRVAMTEGKEWGWEGVRGTQEKRRQSPRPAEWEEKPKRWNLGFLKGVFREGACSDVVNCVSQKVCGLSKHVPMPRASGQIRAGPLSTGEQELAGRR